MEREIQSTFKKKELNINEKRNSLWLLNVLRGISAVLIMLYHYTVQYGKSIGNIYPYPVTVTWGCYAVYTFFILSGYLTIYSYKENTTAKGFLKKRFFRLYPMFWICMCITTVYMFFLMPERVPSIKQFIVNLTMIPSLFGVSAVDGVYWTLIKEIMFYIGFAFVIKIGVVKKNQWIWFWIGLTTFCAIIAYGPINFMGSGKLAQLIIPDYAFTFLAGIAIFYLRKVNNAKERISIYIFIGLCVVNCACLHTKDETIFFLGAIIAVWFCSDEKINKKTNSIKKLLKPILVLSDISYVLYLTHQFIGFGIIYNMENGGIIGEKCIIIPILHACLLALFLHYVVEANINKKIKKLCK